MVGSVEEVKVGNKTVRARQYPWGVVQGEESLIFLSVPVLYPLQGWRSAPTVPDDLRSEEHTPELQVP